jgi:hypothetical protein
MLMGGTEVVGSVWYRRPVETREKKDSVSERMNAAPKREEARQAI